MPNTRIDARPGISVLGLADAGARTHHPNRSQFDPAGHSPSEERHYRKVKHPIFGPGIRTTGQVNEKGLSEVMALAGEDRVINQIISQAIKKGERYFGSWIRGKETVYISPAYLADKIAKRMEKLGFTEET